MTDGPAASPIRVWARFAVVLALAGFLVSQRLAWVTGVGVLTGPLGQSEAEVRSFQRAMAVRHPGGTADAVTRRLLDGGSASGRELARLLEDHLTNWAEAYPPTERRAWTAAVRLGLAWQVLPYVLVLVLAIAGLRRPVPAPVWARALLMLLGLVPLAGAALLALGAPPAGAADLVARLLAQGPGLPVFLGASALAVASGLVLSPGRTVRTALLSLVLLAAVFGGAFAWVRAA